MTKKVATKNAGGTPAIQAKKRPPTSGSFKPGCKGGPGRLPKLKSNEDKHFLPIDVPVYAEPSRDDYVGALADFEYRNKMSDFIVFGYWTKTVYIPKENVRRFIEIYKRGRLKDAQFTKLEAWKILCKEAGKKEKK